MDRAELEQKHGEQGQQRALHDDDILTFLFGPTDEDEDSGGSGTPRAPPQPTPSPYPNFLAADDCFDLDVTIQGALIIQSACNTNGPAFVKAWIGNSAASTKKAGSGSSTPLWSEKLSLGCQPPSEPLEVSLYTGGDPGKSPCASWKVDDWLSRASVNDATVKENGGDSSSNTVVLTRGDGRVNLMMGLTGYYQSKKSSSSKMDFMGGTVQKATFYGIIFACVGSCLVLALSMWCCCLCCCPGYYQAQRRRLGFQASLPTQGRPPSVARPPPPSQPYPPIRPNGRSGTPTPTLPLPPSRPNTAAPPYHGRPPPTVPQYTETSAPTAPQLAVAIPVAEPVNMSNSWRGAWAEATLNGNGGGGGGQGSSSNSNNKNRQGNENERRKG